MTLLAILGVVWLLCIAAVIVAAILAPRGYEDRDGFHRGIPDSERDLIDVAEAEQLAHAAKAHWRFHPPFPIKKRS